MSMKMTEGKTCRWVEPAKQAGENWASLRTAADVDYLAFLVLSDAGLLPASTYLWTAAHCIEKYCKSLILRRNPEANVRAYNHRVDRVWEDTKGLLSSANQQPDFDAFIAELTTIEPLLRYGVGTYGNGTINLTTSPSALLAIVGVLGAALRYDILGATKYQETPFGLSQVMVPRIGSKVAQPSIKAERILHLLLRHNITFSLLAIPDEISFVGISVATAHLVPAEQLVVPHCPWCNGSRRIGQAAAIDLRAYLEVA